MVSVVSMVSLVFEVPAPKHPPQPNLSSKLLIVSREDSCLGPVKRATG